MSQPVGFATESALLKLARGESAWVEVRGASMGPLLRSGDQVRVSPDRVSTLQPGELVLAVSGTGQFLVNRVVSQSAVTVILRGDACPAPDPALSRSQILGIVDQARRGKRLIPLASSGLARPLWSSVLRLRNVWQQWRRRA